MLKFRALQKHYHYLLIGLVALLTACGQPEATNDVDSSAKAVEQLKIEDARIRAMPPGMNISAAFMTLTNPSDQAIEIKSVATPLAKIVELHKTSMQGDVMSMQKIDAIHIPANSTVTLKPGGFHVMLLDVQSALEVDAKHPITLNFSDGSSTEVNAVVVMIGKAHKDHSKH